MSDEAIIRPLAPEDVPAAANAGWSALSALYPEQMVDDEDRRAHTEARVAHLGQTDPGGCWVAEVAGEVVGVSLSLIREGLWGYSLFGLLPGHQGSGLGARLFAPALAYGAEQPAAIIISSTHPAAMRTYARAGFALRPCVALAGAWDPRRVPTGLRSRPGDVGADAELMHAASRAGRGASHARDWEILLARSGTLLVYPDRGFVFAKQDGSPMVLAALDEEAARDLLWSAMVSGPRGGSLEIDFLRAENDWAVQVGLEAGLALSPDGPVFVRGRIGPMPYYLPSGAFL